MICFVRAVSFDFCYFELTIENFVMIDNRKSGFRLGFMNLID